MADPTRIADIEEHRVKSGETLDTLAAANGMTRAELAEFNFGTSEPAAVNQHLRDDVGCTRRDAAGNFIFSDNDDPGIIFIPKKFVRAGLATDQLHVLKVREVSADKNLHRCVCIPGTTFAFDKSFIRPSVVEHLEKVDAALSEFPDAKLIIFGHTDRVGGEQYNKDLSDRRAKSTFAFLTDQPAIWEELYNTENWGLKTVQEILKDLGHDPGPIDGVMGPQTRAAMRSFLGLPDDAPVANDPPFRAKLFLAYMTGKHDVKVTEAQFFPPKFMGCGEFNPAVPPNENELANGGQGRAPGNEPNRRVVVYLFKRPPRNIPCQLHNLAPCKAEIAKPGKRTNPLHKCAFYDGIGEQCKCERGGGGGEESDKKIFMKILDEPGQAPLAGRAYQITRQDAQAQPLTGTTDGQGVLKHLNVAEGAYVLSVKGAEECGALVLDPDDPQPQVRFLREE